MTLINVGRVNDAKGNKVKLEHRIIYIEPLEIIERSK